MHKIQVVYSPSIQWLTEIKSSLIFFKEKKERKQKKKVLKADKVIFLYHVIKFKASEHRFVLRIIVNTGTPIVQHSY